MKTVGDIHFEVRGDIAHVVLDHKQAMNALTSQMCLDLEVRFQKLEKDAAIKAAIIRGAGDKAFCSGGDLRRIYDAHVSGSNYPYEFFRNEYRLLVTLNRFSKPLIVFLDGVVMGGGAGLSFQGSHRVVTETTEFAMPETGVGLFPDAGSAFFLPRCPGQVGTFLGLTGTHIGAADCLYSGLADTYIPASKLAVLSAALDQADLGENPFSAVNKIFQDFQEVPSPSFLRAHRTAIDRIFGLDSVEDIVDALAGERAPWAKRTWRWLVKRASPTSLKIALRQLRWGEGQNFDDCIRLEWRIVNRILKGHDFFEGIRSVLIDGDHRPRWCPKKVSDVLLSDIESYFSPLVDDELVLD
ncbi:MAG: enoyl-CoA hydratase/isomerase family protein [Rhodospirillales bacterium]|nr:enoyl-CoA hydratase/isomerase family protein [Rhodospirillales bacterium]